MDADIDHVESALETLIEEVGIGGILPGERALAEQLGVSRTLLRDRLSLLESLGVLERRAGAGTRVSRLDPTRLGRGLSLGLILEDHSAESLQSVRVALERQAAREAAETADHVEIARMRVAFDAMVAAESREDSEHADFEFHTHLLRASGNPSIVFLVDALDVALRHTFHERSQQLVMIPDWPDLRRRIHEPILEAVAAGKPRAAMEAVDAAFDAFDHSLEAVRQRSQPA